MPPLPSLFFKGSNSIAGHGETVEIPKICQDDQADYEGELVVIIGKDAKNVSKDDALDYVLGYTAGNDVSSRLLCNSLAALLISRKWQRDPKLAGGVPQWGFSKSCNHLDGDSLTLLGLTNTPPWVRRLLHLRYRLCENSLIWEVIPDPSTLVLETRVNGQLRQSTNTSDMLFDVRTLIAFLSQGTTLEAGSIIMTGTPEGIRQHSIRAQSE